MGGVTASRCGRNLFPEDIDMDGFRLELLLTAESWLPPLKAVFPWLSLKLLDSRIEVVTVFQDGGV